MKLLQIVYIVIVISLVVFSFGFVDPNLTLSSSEIFETFHGPLKTLVFDLRPIATTLFFFLLSFLFIFYIWFIGAGMKSFSSGKKLAVFLIVISGILVFSFPALTYDLFNYITTAKVIFFHHENPYLVMPIEIPNESYLHFTRAANKLALYGPVWIGLTSIPHYLGQGNIWLTIISFKLMNALWYLGFSLLIYRVTKSIRNVLFFSLNPLVLIEVLVSGHNDISMMTLALAGLLLWEKREIGKKIVGFLLFIASFLIKGATLILLPLFFLKNISWDRLLFIGYCLLSLVFFIFAPLREELYPWYAVWLISVAAIMDMKKYRILMWFTIALSFGLELRHLPYMWMGIYGGVGPTLRIVLTAVPIAVFILYFGVKKIRETKY